MGKQIEVNGVSLQLKRIRGKDVVNIKEFMDKFDKDLVEYIRDEATKCEDTMGRALKKLYTLDIFTKMNFESEFQKYGHLPIWKGTWFGWKQEVISLMRGSAFRGKKRPEHSKVMSKKMKVAANNRTDAHKKNLSTFLKGEYYRKRPLTLGLVTEKEAKEFTIERLKNIISSYNRDRIKSKEYRLMMVDRFKSRKKYASEELHKKYLCDFESVTPDNVEEAYSAMMSIISIVAMKNDPNMGTTKFFKKGTIKVSHCTNKTIVTYRSSWELDTILFFESIELKYQYEPFYIPKGNGKAYLPDFVIELPDFDKPIILELKGFVRGASGKESEKMKVSSAIEFAKSNNYHYSYCKKPIEALEQVRNNLLT